MRKEWSGLVAVLMVAALAACGGDQSGTADEAANTDSVPATTAAPPPPPAGGAPTTTAALPAGVTQEMVTQGQQIFTTNGNCYTCHGMDAKGTQLCPNLTDNQWINVAGGFDEIVNVVKTGVATPKQHPAPMPAMGGAQLSDDQVRAVAAYVYSISRGS